MQAHSCKSHRYASQTLTHTLMHAHAKGQFKTVEVVAGARVPILKLRFVPTGQDVDVCLNNRLAVTNTHLLGQVRLRWDILEHSGTFWDILEHSRTFWNIWNILAHYEHSKILCNISMHSLRLYSLALRTPDTILIALLLSSCQPSTRGLAS